MALAGYGSCNESVDGERAYDPKLGAGVPEPEEPPKDHSAGVKTVTGWLLCWGFY